MSEQVPEETRVQSQSNELTSASQKKTASAIYATPVHSPDREKTLIALSGNNISEMNAYLPILKTVLSPVSQPRTDIPCQELTPPASGNDEARMHARTSSDKSSSHDTTISVKLFQDDSHVRSHTGSSSILSEPNIPSIVSKRKSILVSIYCGTEQAFQTSLNEILRELKVQDLKHPGKHYDFAFPLDSEGYTAVHWAAFCGRVSLVKSLIDRGAHACPLTRRGETPLHKAVLGIGSFSDFVFSELVKSLSSNIFVPDNQGRTVLHYIALSTQFPNRVKISSYYMSVISDFIRMRQRLTGNSYAAFLNARNVDGDTALHVACRNRQYRCVEILTRLGASPEIPNQSGDTPLSLSAKDVRLLRILHRKPSHHLANLLDFQIDDYDDPPTTPFPNLSSTDSEGELRASLAETMNRLEYLYGSKNARQILDKLASPLKSMPTPPLSLPPDDNDVKVPKSNNLLSSPTPSSSASQTHQDGDKFIHHAADLLRSNDTDLYEIKDLTKSLARIFRKSDSIQSLLKEKLNIIDKGKEADTLSSSTTPEKRTRDEFLEEDEQTQEGSQRASIRLQALKRRRLEPGYSQAEMNDYLSEKLDRLQSAIQRCEETREAVHEELSYMKKERLVKDVVFQKQLGKLCRVPMKAIPPALRRITR